MKRVLLLVLLGLAVSATPAWAELTVFQTFTGKVGVSTDGFGSSGSSGTISAEVPLGATVLAAYLYTATNFGTVGGGTLNGTAVSYGPRVANATACCNLAHQRADVTSIVAPVINGGAGGIYNFTVTETASGGQDGEALVVVYSLSTLPDATVGILDGWASVTGDTTSINFASPLNPAAPGFFAEMRLGIGFSFNFGDSPGQTSTVNVNGTLITSNAGNFDDGVGANGGLITVGGVGDGFSPLLPSVLNDHERYNLVPFIDSGDTSIVVQTANASRDDNIFLAVFHVSGIAGVNEPPPNGDPDPDPDPSVPEPSMLMLAGVALAAGIRRHRATH